MRINRLRQVKLTLYIYLTRGVIEQIRPAHDMSYPLCGIVDHDRQQIGEYPIAPLQDHIADCRAHVLSEHALYAIIESDGAAIDFQTRCVRHPVA